VNFQLPQQDDEFDYYGNSSQDEEESRDSRRGNIITLSDYIVFWILIIYLDYYNACEAWPLLGLGVSRCVPVADIDTTQTLMIILSYDIFSNHYWC
jgi:hypothetical protein